MRLASRCGLLGQQRLLLGQRGRSIQKLYNTIVEGVNAPGWKLPPMIILKGKVHQAWEKQYLLGDDMVTSWRLADEPTPHLYNLKRLT